MSEQAPRVAGPTERVETALRLFLDAQAEAVEAADEAAAATVAEIRRVLAAGGKRLRPTFCYWGFRAGGGSDCAEIVNAAASLELLHTFAVIHDDLMDRSPMRRGQPATHVAMGGDRFGVSSAVLVGDLALILADRMLVESGFSPERLVAAFHWYNRMRVEVVAGQFVDLLAARDAAADEPAARRIAALKSGGYTVEKPLQIGAALAGADPGLHDRLAAYGAPLGEAFQLRDDVLGTFGEPSVTGKEAEGDLREGKQTVLVAKARALASPDDRAFLEARLGRPDLSAGDVERLRAVLRDSGALGATLALIERLRAQALDELRAAGLDSEVTTALEDLAGIAVERDT